MNSTQPTIEVVSEHATVEKRDVVTGKVRVETRTEHHDELVTAALRTEHLSVERIPVNREVDEAPPIRTEGDLTVIPVVEEILVVEKRLMLREEVHIRRSVSDEAVETSLRLRKQHAVVQRIDGTEAPTEEETSNEPDIER